MENKMCPHCGSQMFMAKIIRPGLVSTTADPNEPYKILKEGQGKFDIEIVECARCREVVTEEALVTGVKCKECGRIVGPMDVNEDSVCNVCVAVKQREELANASREDLIQMLLNAEKKANPVTKKIEKQIEIANSIPTEDEQVKTEETSAEAKTGKRKASRRKKEDDDVKNDEEPAVQEEVSAPIEAVDDIANQQEAPFPDIAMNPPEVNVEVPTSVPSTTESSADDEQPIGADFRMFEDGEEPF